MKFEFILTYNHNFLNQKFKRRLIKFAYRITLLFKVIYKHFYLIESFVLIIKMCDFL